MEFTGTGRLGVVSEFSRLAYALHSKWAYPGDPFGLTVSLRVAWPFDRRHTSILLRIAWMR